MPIQAFNNASYFIIRSGGKTWITFLFDSFFCWVVSIPLAFLTWITFLFDSFFCWVVSIPLAFFLAHYTQLPIVPMYALVSGSELLKVGIGLTLVNRGVWIRDITV